MFYWNFKDFDLSLAKKDDLFFDFQFAGFIINWS
jgi:hypothetical protein